MFRIHHPLQSIFWLLFGYLLCCWAAEVNITIDDGNGDSVTGVLPIYSPASIWVEGATCGTCLDGPDPAQAKDGTWHDATWAPGGNEGYGYTIEMNFNGSAVYVYFILANYIQYVTTLTNVSFYLDGEHSGDFVHIPTTSSDYEYNALAYAKTDIAPISSDMHNLTIITVGKTNNSLVIFDYALYTIESVEAGPDPVSATTVSAQTTTTSASPSTSISSQSINTNTDPNVSNATPSVSVKISNILTSTNSAANVNVTNTNSMFSNVATGTPVTASAPSAFSSSSSSPGSSDAVHASSRINVGAVAGGASGGGLALLILLVLLLWFFKKRPGKVVAKGVEPYPMEEPNTSSLFDRNSMPSLKVPPRISQPLSITQSSIGSTKLLNTNLRGTSTDGSLTNPSRVGSPSNNSLIQESALSRTALPGQVQEIQEAISTLQTQRESLTSASGPDVDHGPPVLSDTVLHQRITTLQAEIERLHANQEHFLGSRDAIIDLPPDYNDLI